MRGCINQELREGGRGTARGTVGFVDPRLIRLLDLLDTTEGETVSTSVRLPVSLRDAAVLAAELGLASSTSELTVRGLRDLLAAAAQRALLDAHYQAHPEARPDLAEIALAAAALDGNPLGEPPELVQWAAAEIVSIIDDSTPTRCSATPPLWLRQRDPRPSRPRFGSELHF